MRFIHLADCHLGGWRDDKMKALNLASFSRVIEDILKNPPDFVIIAGDLFNTSIPPLDVLKEATILFRKVRKAGIPVYMVAGSHDYSPSGRTMLDVLEEAGLFRNVMRGTVKDGRVHLSFTVDEKTGVKITGILGRRGMLDKEYYEALAVEDLEREPGEKIFLFHTSIDELKPKDKGTMEGMAVSMLPKGFLYYAGGHVHIRKDFNAEGYRNVVYPGPTFPNSFSELEELRAGSYMEYDDGKVTRHRIELKEVVPLAIDCDGKTPESVRQELDKRIEEGDWKDKIVLIRLHGRLCAGRIQDLRLQELMDRIDAGGAYMVMRNTAKLQTAVLEEVKVRVHDKEALEREVIAEHIGKIKDLGLAADKETELTIRMMQALMDDRKEGEKKDTFERRMEEAADALLAGTKK